MDEKNKEIIRQKNRQLQLRKEIKSIKSKFPTFFIGFALIATIAIYYLQSKIYMYFGNAINFIKFGIAIFIIINIIYFYRSFVAVQKREKELEVINNKLFKLMKLETENINE